MTPPITSLEQLLAAYPINLSYVKADDRLWFVGLHGTVQNVPNYGLVLAACRAGLNAAQDVYRFFIDKASQRWWIGREIMRFTHGVYLAIPPEILRHVTKNVGLTAPIFHFVHVSPDDPMMVEFTYTPADGLRDKRTQMGLGRYLAQFYPWALDQEVQAAEAEYRADLSNEFEIEYGGERILYWYLHGPTSCMAKPATAWHKGLHPVFTYDAPGWGIAFLRKAGDTKSASARSLVWIDPNNEHDKYYIRTYGDTQLLERRLKRRGFKHEIPPRAPLRYVEYSGDPTRIVLPYMDSAGTESSFHLLWEADRPWLLKPSVYKELAKDPEHAPYLFYGSYDQHIPAPNKRPKLECDNCGASAKELKSRDGWLFFDKTICAACAKKHKYVEATGYRGTVTYRTVAKHEDTIEVFSHDNSLVGVFLNDTDFKKCGNYGSLDPKYYFDEPENLKRVYQKHPSRFVEQNSYLWRKEDCSRLVRLADEHHQEFSVAQYNLRDNGIDLEQLIKLAPIPGQIGEVYGDASTKKFVKGTTTKTNIIPETHKDGYSPFLEDPDLYIKTASNFIVTFQAFLATFVCKKTYKPWSPAIMANLPKHKILYSRLKEAAQLASNGSVAARSFAEMAWSYRAYNNSCIVFEPHRKDFVPVYFNTADSIDSLKFLLSPTVDEVFFARLGAKTAEQQAYVMWARENWLEIRRITLEICRKNRNEPTEAMEMEI